MPRQHAQISPTAHYTGHVWYRSGQSDRSLRTFQGAFMYAFVRPGNELYERLFGGPTLETVLLDRHAVIDAELEARIVRGEVGQVLEVAAGLSPRGLRFVRRHPNLRYVEADLPGMAARKRDALAPHALPQGRHRVVAIDAFAEAGALSVAAVAAQHLQPDVGTAIITEGLVNYFDQFHVEGLWRRFASVLGGYPNGVYLSDLHLRSETLRLKAARYFRRGLEQFTGGKVHFHYLHAVDAELALSDVGFARVQLLRPSATGVQRPGPKTNGEDIVRVVVAEV
jgi:O-methyltransferase involved in polyketide biosynthesis